MSSRRVEKLRQEGSSDSPTKRRKLESQTSSNSDSDSDRLTPSTTGLTPTAASSLTLNSPASTSAENDADELKTPSAARPSLVTSASFGANTNANDVNKLMIFIPQVEDTMQIPEDEGTPAPRLPPVTPRTTTHHSALHSAVVREDLRSVSALLANASTAHLINAADHNGFTSLMNAAALETSETSAQVAGMLLGFQFATVDVDKADTNGYTASHWAAQCGHLGTLRLLARHGADLHSVDAVGDSPLHRAARFGNAGCIAALVTEFGLDATQRNRTHQSPLDVCGQMLVAEPKRTAVVQRIATPSPVLDGLLDAPPGSGSGSGIGSPAAAASPAASAASTPPGTPRTPRATLDECLDASARLQLLKLAPQLRTLLLWHPDCLQVRFTLTTLQHAHIHPHACYSVV